MVVQPSGAFPQIQAPPAPEPCGEIPEAQKKSPGLRVLVVDDEPLVLWSITEMLRSRGMQVQEAASAKTALRVFTGDEEPPDVVLLDLNLPDSADLAPLSMMRKIAPKTRVILMTAYGTPEVCAEARRLGVFTVMEKPFDLDTLDGLVTRAVQ